MKLFGVTGWKNCGKTGLMERLVAEFIASGLRVSTIKRTHHDVDLDQPGTDSFRHRAAGAEEVMLASDQRWTLMREEKTTDLATLLSRMAPVDLVLVEGFKSAPHPKIETFRHEASNKGLIAERNPTIIALASDTPQATDLPQFHLDDTKAIAVFIANRLKLAL